MHVHQLVLADVTADGDDTASRAIEVAQFMHASGSVPAVPAAVQIVEFFVKGAAVLGDMGTSHRA